MSLKEQLAEDLKDAIRHNDETRKNTIRMATTAIKNAEVASGKPLDDQGVVGILAKEAKQRKESIDQFEKAGRQDLVDKETAELKVLESYLPETMSRDEIVAEAKSAIEEVGAVGPSDKGKVMSKLMPKLAGRAEGREINEIVTELLSS